MSEPKHLIATDLIKIFDAAYHQIIDDMDGASQLTINTSQLFESILDAMDFSKIENVYLSDTFRSKKDLSNFDKEYLYRLYM